MKITTQTKPKNRQVRPAYQELTVAFPKQCFWVHTTYLFILTETISWRCTDSAHFSKEIPMETDCLPLPSSSGAPLAVGSWGHSSACALEAPGLEDPSTSASPKPHPVTMPRSSRRYFGFVLLRTALQNYPCRSILVLSWPVETSKKPSSLPFVTRFFNTSGISSMVWQRTKTWQELMQNLEQISSPASFRAEDQQATVQVQPVHEVHNLLLCSTAADQNHI